MILRFILLWLSILGMVLYIKKKKNIKVEFILPILLSLLGIIMFIAGLLNIMKISALIIWLAGIVYFLYCVIKKQKEVKEILTNKNLIIYFMVVIYIMLLGSNMKLLHYDNFSHWGVIVKNMFNSNALPTFENPAIMFKGYQPGSACFIYYYGLLVGKTEGMMIAAHNILIFTYFFSLFAFIKKEEFLKKIFLIVTFIFIMVLNINFNDLLVDTLISLMAVSSFAIIYYYKDNLKKAVMLSAPILLFLILVKNTGIILAGFSCLYILFLGYKNKNIKEAVKYIFIIGVIFAATLLIWQGHVSMVYGNAALNSKHSLSAENIIKSLRQKGIENALKFIKIYIVHFFNIKKNIGNIFMLILNAILLVFSVVFKQRKKILKLLGAIDILYIGYFLILGVMYLLSMPLNEAMVLAGFDRYMLTIVVVNIGIILIYILNYKLTKKQGKLFIAFISILIIAMSLTVIFRPGRSKILIGKTNYKDSIVEKFDQILDIDDFDYTKEYYVYAPSSKKDSGYCMFLSRYKLNTDTATVISSVSDLEKEEDIDGRGLIVLETDEEIMEYIDKHKWEKESENVYIK